MPKLPDIRSIYDKLPMSLGGMWIRGHRMTERILMALNYKQLACPSCSHRFHGNFSMSDIPELKRQSQMHTIAIKLKSMKEKYIAVENRDKHAKTDPDYFVYLYQPHTGAAPEYPFSLTSQDGSASTEANVRVETKITITGSPSAVHQGVKDPPHPSVVPVLEQELHASGKPDQALGKNNSQAQV